MSLEFSCPTCGKQLSAPESVAGRSTTCPGCGTPVQISAQHAALRGEHVVEPGTPAGREVEAYGVAPLPDAPVGTRCCPACHSEMPVDAALCVQCGHDLRSASPGASMAENADGRTPARRARNMVLLVVGFFVVLGGIAGVAQLVMPGGSDADEETGQVADQRKSGPRDDWLQQFFMGTEYPARDRGLTFGRVVEEHSADSSKLPFALSRRALAATAAIAELDGDKLVAGWVYGPRSELKAPLFKAGVEEFKLPEGLRLLQVRYQLKEMRTLAGQIFNYVGQINQYFAVDSNGQRYPVAGYYAVLKRSGGEYIELFFNGAPDNPINPGYACMLDFKTIERSELNDRRNSVIYLLFLVPPGTEITRIENQTGDGVNVSLRSRAD